MDWLTAAITLAPSILAALTLLFAYLQNRDNHNAEIRKVAFEKRIDAFKEVLAHLTKAQDDYVRYILAWVEDERNVPISRESAKESHDKLQSVYYNNRLLLTPHIDTLMKTYAQALKLPNPYINANDEIRNRDKDKFMQSITIMTNLHDQITKEMHKIVGYK